VDTSPARATAAGPGTTTPLPSADPAVVRTQFRADLALSAGTGLLMMLMFSASDIARQALGASDAQVALLHSAPHIGLLCTLFVGAWMRGRPKRPFVILPAALALAALALVGFAPDANWFVAGVMVAFSVNALSVPARTALYGRNYPPATRGQLVARLRLVVSAARLLLGGLAAAWVLAEADAYRYVFPLAGGFGLVLLWPYRRVPDAPDPHAGPALGVWGNLRNASTLLGRDRPFARFMGLWFLFGLSNLMTMPLMVLLLADVAAPLDQAEGLSQAFLLRNVVPPLLWLGTLSLWGRTLDHGGPTVVRGRVNLVWALCPIIWALWPMAMRRGWTGIEAEGATLAAITIGGLYVAQVFQGLAQSGGQLVWQLAAVSYARESEDVSAYMSVHTTLTGVRGLFAPWLAIGLASWIGTEETILACGIVMILTGLATIAFDRDPGRQSAGPTPLASNH
jgi:hypothetical protein